MIRSLLLPLTAIAFHASFAGTPHTIRTVQELLNATYVQPTVGKRFEISGTILYPSAPVSSNGFISVSDATGAIGLYDINTTCGKTISAGDRIRITGITETDNRNLIYASGRLLEVLGHETPPPPKAATATEILSGELDFRTVSFTGTVRDIFIDEIDPRTLFFVLHDGERTLYAALLNRHGISANRAKYEGAHITIHGLCIHSDHGYRMHLGRYIQMDGDDAISIVKPPPQPFAARNLEDLPRIIQPSELSSIGKCLTSGKVIAVWDEHNLLLRRKNGSTLEAKTADAVLPRYGDVIEVVGFPETDLYKVNLSRAIWRLISSPERTLEPTKAIHIQDLLIHESGMPRFNYAYHGKAIRLNGMVRILTQDGKRRMVIEDDGYSIPVCTDSCDASAMKLTIGCEVEVAGICIMETDSWRPNSDFPHINGIVVVPRVESDITVLRHPPWWTPRRLSIVIATLLSILVGILIWNAALRRFAIRKGHELFKAQVAKVSTELRIDERTRLAVELHDSISQNLTGVSMQIDSADRFLDSDKEKTRLHLGIASRTLDSCREELRNCIWDLRSRALEENNMEDAIRTALLHHIGSASLNVRFNVARTKFSDKTTHTILCIVRELATNAVRHGHAKNIRIAGAVEHGRLCISVTDDGCGFDVTNHPGISDGHFGLQGISERIKAYHGTLKIESTLQHGSRAVLEMTLTKQEKA